MKVSASTVINSSKDNVWKVITDIENSVTNITDIKKIEILNQPSDGLDGLKWRETRNMFGKEASEVMWITDIEPNIYYKTRAESHGMIYISTLTLEELACQTKLTMSFEDEPASVVGKILSVLFGKLMKNTTEKALKVDLEDIKYAVESVNSN